MPNQRLEQVLVANYIKMSIPNLSPPAMRYVAAYLLAHLGGKENPTKEDVQQILESVGLDVDNDKLSKVRGCIH